MNRDLGRTEDWFIKRNSVTLTSGVLTSDSGFNSLTPLNYSSGSGGVAALSQTVLFGDVISLEFLRHSGEPFGTFMGVDLSVQFTPVPEPGSFVLAAGALLVGVLRNVRRRG